MNTKPSKKGLYAALGGTLLTALCCLSPILVLTLGAIGLSAFTPYLDYVLWPALAVMVVVSVVAYKKYRDGCRACETTEQRP